MLRVLQVGVALRQAATFGPITEPSRLAALIANKTAPSVTVTVDVMALPHGTVIAVDVPKATHGLVATTCGVYLRRAIDVTGRPQCLPMQPHEAMARLSNLGARDVSTLRLEGLSEDDLDAAELRRFRSVAQAGGDTVLGDLSDRDLLTALGFTDLDGRLTLGAVLMFGTPATLQRFSPTQERRSRSSTPTRASESTASNADRSCVRCSTSSMRSSPTTPRRRSRPACSASACRPSRR